jgi:X-Pro dipeptidyl-peptidase
MPEHSYRIYKKAQDMGLTTQIYYHQNGHGGPPPLAMMNKWFTKYLHGIDNGVENEENKAHIVREYDNRQEPTLYKDYPNPDAKDVTLQLTSGGNTKGGLVLKAKDNAKETLIDDVSFSGKDLATAETSNHRLLYVTPKLKEAVHISGLAKMSITLSSDKPAANLSVWLVSLPWQDGKEFKITDNLITRNWADPKNYKSLTDEEDLIPGKFYTVNFDLQPDDQIIKAGQQIGLLIFSSDQEFTLHPKAGTKLTVQLDKTTLTLPVVGGKDAFEKALD